MPGFISASRICYIPAVHRLTKQYFKRIKLHVVFSFDKITLKYKKRDIRTERREIPEQKEKRKKKMGINRTERVEIFEDTKRLVKENEKLKKAVEYSNAHQTLIPESEDIAVKADRYEKDASVTVSAKRSFEAARAYNGKKVSVLNFASATNPGGGVTKGASAQEECLCRISTLYFNLNTKEMWDGFYGPHRAFRNPLHTDDIIYTPEVVVFKTDTDNPVIMKEEDWYTLDVITCAAPNLRNMPSNAYNSGDGDIAVKPTEKELYALHVKRFTKILQAAVANGAEVIILGAFGCGAFENDPKVVAQAAKDAIAPFLRSFETIEFAVYCTKEHQENYEIFRRVLNRMKGEQ